jgi:hypothetical protein
MLLHHLQCITKLVQLGFALLVGKQTGLDHENLRQVRGAHIMPDTQRFFEVPKSLLSIPKQTIGLAKTRPAVGRLLP